jgi:RHS repeat-associated protein
LVTKVRPPVAEGAAWEFKYDGQLNRYWMNRGGTERYLLWDGLNCLEERNADGSLHARYTYGMTQIYGIGSCVEIYKPGAPDKWYTLIMDHRGTAYAILDENGAEIGRRQYDAFGVILSETGTWPTDLAYQTNWQTVQIGNKWWGISAARMYDFSTGRFGQRDPIKATLNMYRYVYDNPVLLSDSNGLESADQCREKCFWQYRHIVDAGAVSQGLLQCLARCREKEKPLPAGGGKDGKGGPGGNEDPCCGTRKLKQLSTDFFPGKPDDGLASEIAWKDAMNAAGTNDPDSLNNGGAGQVCVAKLLYSEKRKAVSVYLICCDQTEEKCPQPTQECKPVQKNGDYSFDWECECAEKGGKAASETKGLLDNMDF